MVQKKILKILFIVLLFCSANTKAQNEQYPHPDPTQDYRYPIEREAPDYDADDKGSYKINLNQPEQTILGLGFEIQSDRYPSEVARKEGKLFSGVPNDLVPEERIRFYKEMLTGFRYMRLAGGLWFRGVTDDGENIKERWKGQAVELGTLVREAGLEGISFEYWSPAPYWKANGKMVGADGTENILRCFGKHFAEDSVYKGDTIKFLHDFGASIIKDMEYLKSRGMPVKVFGIQNEPFNDTNYGGCKYTAEQYYITFKTIAPLIKKYNPDIEIIADTHHGPHSEARLVAADPKVYKYVDSWVYHRIGRNSNTLIDHQDYYLAERHGKPVYQNEFEYLSGSSSPARTLNTVQSIMNWFTFINSPTWYWLHALKPAKDNQANFSLGYWRPYDDETTKDIEKGHYKYDRYSWNAIVGFLKHMPWDCVRYDVKEDKNRHDNRIMAYRKPNGKLVILVSNRVGKPFTFHIETGTRSVFKGFRYTPESAGKNFQGQLLENHVKGKNIQLTVPDMAWEFWVEQ